MKKYFALLIAVVMLIGVASGCKASTPSATTTDSGTAEATAAPEAATEETAAPAAEQKVYDDGYGYNVMRIGLDQEISTADVQLTTEDYTIPLNIYDNLVEVKSNDDGTSEIVGALAESWDVSDDGLVYTFHLRPNVKFHNGEIFEADDVKYTIERMLDPARLAKNTDCMDMIKGAQAMLDGPATECEGVKVIDANTVEITLEQAYAPFLANACVPGFAIYNREAGEAADAAGGGISGSQFGVDPALTVGTGPFMMKEWVLNDHIYLETNPDYWKGASKLDGILFRVIADNDTRRMMFENGEFDEFDLDTARELIPDYLASEQWKNNVVVGNRVGTYYYSINESIEPFDDVRVRKALQMAIDRQGILDALYSGAGVVANGIFAPGMVGYNPDLAAIPYDPEQAKALLTEAGYPNGFEMTISQVADNPTTLSINELVQAQLAQLGITVTIEQMDEGTWFDVRRTGALPMYETSWSADFNDPDNFIYTFFSPENTVKRSFNYYNKDAMQRIVNARYMVDPEARVKEYQDLEKLVIQDDAAWIPLFHLQHIWVFSDRVHDYTPHWAGWTATCYWSCYLT